ncbi:MAG TPA: hypothetical protein VML55_02355 [Planctomycetaceae bacterium]|nr:hypothetical protein [Planctomycetaceae bacterium]
MTDTPRAQDPWRRAKLAAIPVLGLVLVWVMPGRDDPPAVAPAALADTQGADRQAAGLDNAANAAGGRRTSDGTGFTLDEILAHDPFAVPPALARPQPPESPSLLTRDSVPTEPVSAELPHPEPGQSRLRLETLSQKRVSIIYRGPGGPTAVIDSREYREGDELAAGIRILEIRSDGVLVEVHELH